MTEKDMNHGKEKEPCRGMAQKHKADLMILAFSAFALLVSLVALIISICMLNS